MPAPRTIGQMLDSERHQVVLDLAIESMRRPGNLQLRVHGTSMLPTIRPGAWVAIRQTAADQISTGDIVLSKACAGLRLHRVVEIRYLSSGPMFVTRGDNHWHTDQPAGAREPPGTPDGVLSEPATRCLNKSCGRNTAGFIQPDASQGNLRMMDRGDFQASYDPVSRPASIRQNADRHGLDSVIRIIPSLTLADRIGIPSAGMRLGALARGGGRSGTGLIRTDQSVTTRQ